MEICTTTVTLAAKTALRLRSEPGRGHDNFLLEELLIAHCLGLERLVTIKASVHQTEQLLISSPHFADVILDFNRCDILLRATFLILFFARV